jgi:hypothetical protein
MPRLILISLVLHGVLLGIPLPEAGDELASDSSMIDAETATLESEGPLEITMLPTASPPPDLPKPSSAVPPPSQQPPTTHQTTLEPSFDHQPAPDTAPVSAASEDLPDPPPESEPPAHEDSPDDPPPDDPPPDDPPPSDPPPTNPLSGFQLSNAQVGCFNSDACWKVSDNTSFRQVGRTLTQQLEAQGYSLQLRDDLSESGRQVMEISHNDIDNGQVNYLSILSSGLGETVYLIADRPLTLQDLENL